MLGKTFEEPSAVTTFKSVLVAGWHGIGMKGKWSSMWLLKYITTGLKHPMQQAKKQKNN
jgi:hypothetical protein